MPPKADWEKYSGPKGDKKDDEPIVALDEGDIQLLKTYGQGPYAAQLKSIEREIKEVQARIAEKQGVKESDTGLAPPNLWDIPADKQRMGEEQPLQVARCTKIIKAGEGRDKAADSAPDAAAAPGGAGGALGGLARALGGAAPGGGAQPAAEEEDKYVINVKQIAKFVVGLGERVAPTDIEEGMRVG
jgi:26S proteasome regulatory subunit T1